MMRTLWTKMRNVNMPQPRPSEPSLGDDDVTVEPNHGTCLTTINEREGEYQTAIDSGLNATGAQGTFSSSEHPCLRPSSLMMGTLGLQRQNFSLVPTSMVVCNRGFLGEVYRAPTRLISCNYRATVQLDPFLDKYLGGESMIYRNRVSGYQQSIPPNDEKPEELKLFNALPYAGHHPFIDKNTFESVKFSVSRITGHPDDDHFHLTSTILYRGVQYELPRDASYDHMVYNLMNQNIRKFDRNLTTIDNQLIDDNISRFCHEHGIPVMGQQLSLYNPCYFIPELEDHCRVDEQDCRSFAQYVLSIHNHRDDALSSIFSYTSYGEDGGFNDPICELFSDNVMYINRALMLETTRSLIKHRDNHLSEYKFTTDDNNNSIPLRRGHPCPDCHIRASKNTVPTISSGRYCESHAFVIMTEVNRHRASQNLFIVPSTVPGSKVTAIPPKIFCCTPHVVHDEYEKQLEIELRTYQKWFCVIIAFFQSYEIFKPCRTIIARKMTAKFVEYWREYQDQGALYDPETGDDIDVAEAFLSADHLVIDDMTDIMEISFLWAWFQVDIAVSENINEIIAMFRTLPARDSSDATYNMIKIPRKRIVCEGATLHSCERCVMDNDNVVTQESYIRNNDDSSEWMCPYSIPLNQRTRNFSYMPVVFDSNSHFIIDVDDPIAYVQEMYEESGSDVMDQVTHMFTHENDARINIISDGNWDNSQRMNVPTNSFFCENNIPRQDEMELGSEVEQHEFEVYLNSLRRGEGFEDDAHGYKREMNGHNRLGQPIHYREQTISVPAVDKAQVDEVMNYWTMVEKTSPGDMMNISNYGGWRAFTDSKLQTQDYTQYFFTAWGPQRDRSDYDDTIGYPTVRNYKMVVSIIHQPDVQIIDTFGYTTRVDMGKIVITCQCANFGLESDTFHVHRLWELFSSQGLQIIYYPGDTRCVGTLAAMAIRTSEIVTQALADLKAKAIVKMNDIRDNVVVARDMIVEAVEVTATKIRDTVSPKPVGDPYFSDEAANEEEEEISFDLEPGPEIVAPVDPIIENIAPEPATRKYFNIPNMKELFPDYNAPVVNIERKDRAGCMVIKERHLSSYFSKNGIFSKMPLESTAGISAIGWNGSNYHVAVNTFIMCPSDLEYFKDCEIIVDCDCDRHQVEYKPLTRAWWVWDNLQHQIMNLWHWIKSLFQRKRNEDDAYGITRENNFHVAKGSRFKARSDALWMDTQDIVFDVNECSDNCLWFALTRWAAASGYTRKFTSFLSSTPGTNVRNPAHMAEVHRFAKEFNVCVYVCVADLNGTMVVNYKFDDLDHPRTTTAYFCTVIEKEFNAKHWIYSIPHNSKNTYHRVHTFDRVDGYVDFYRDVPEPCCLDQMRTNLKERVALSSQGQQIYTSQAKLAQYFNMQFPLMKKIEYAADSDLITTKKEAAEHKKKMELDAARKKILEEKKKKEEAAAKKKKAKDDKTKFPKAPDADPAAAKADPAAPKPIDTTGKTPAQIRQMARANLGTTSRCAHLFLTSPSKLTKLYSELWDDLLKSCPDYDVNKELETYEATIIDGDKFLKLLILSSQFDDMWDHIVLTGAGALYKSKATTWPIEPKQLITKSYDNFLKLPIPDKKAVAAATKKFLVYPDVDDADDTVDKSKTEPDKTGDKTSSWDDSSLSKDPKATKDPSDTGSSDDGDSDEDDSTTVEPRIPVGMIRFSHVNAATLSVFKNYVEHKDYEFVELSDEYAYEFYDEDKLRCAEYAIQSREDDGVRIDYMIESTHETDVADLFMDIIKPFAPKTVVTQFTRLRNAMKKKETINYAMVTQKDMTTMIKLEADGKNDPRSDLAKNTTLKTDDMIVGKYSKHSFRDIKLSDIQELWDELITYHNHPDRVIPKGQLKSAFRFTGMTESLDKMIEKNVPEYLRFLSNIVDTTAPLAGIAAPEWCQKLLTCRVITDIAFLVRDIVRFVTVKYFCHIKIEEIVYYEYYPQIVSHCMIQKVSDDLKLDEARFDIAIQQAMRSHGRMMEPNSERLTGTKLMCKIRFRRKQEQQSQWLELLNPNTDAHGNVKVARGYSCTDVDMTSIMKPTREMAADSEIVAFIESYTKPYRKPAAFQLPGGSAYCCPYADSGEAVNTLIGATHRLLNKKDKDYSEETLQELEKASMYIYMMMPPFDIEEFTPLEEILKGKSGAVIKAYLEAADDYDDIETKDFYSIKAFSKWEAYDTIKHNRNIFPRSLEFRAMCMCYMYAAQKHFFKFITNNIKGLDARGKEKKVQECLDKFLSVMMSDYTSFESHATVKIMERIEIPFFTRMILGLPGGDIFLKIFGSVAALNEIVGQAFKAYVMARRQSGEVQTSWFNFLLNFCFIQAAFKATSGSYCEKVLCEGDDIILSAETWVIEKVAKWLKDAGVDIKIEHKDQLWKASFCGMHYTDDGRHVVNPIRAILRMGWANPQYLRSRKSVHEALMWMKATSCLCEHPSNPMTSAYCKRIIDFYCPNPTMVNRLMNKMKADVYTKDKMYHALNTTVSDEEPSLTQRLAVEELFDIHIDEQLEFENYVKNVWDPREELDHEVIRSKIDDVVMMYNDNYVDSDIESDNIVSRPPMKVIEEIPGLNIFRDPQNPWRYYLTSASKPLRLNKLFKKRERGNMPPGLLDLWLKH